MRQPSASSLQPALLLRLHLRNAFAQVVVQLFEVTARDPLRQRHAGERGQRPEALGDLASRDHVVAVGVHLAEEQVGLLGRELPLPLDHLWPHGRRPCARAAQLLPAGGEVREEWLVSCARRPRRGLISFFRGHRSAARSGDPRRAPGCVGLQLGGPNHRLNRLGIRRFVVLYAEPVHSSIISPSRTPSRSARAPAAVAPSRTR
jgi:hypothetical protein